MGLAQMYQLRGRVGRSTERAFAYLFFPPQRELTEEAHERLTTIARHQSLGSGFRIAMRDLEIRGAGNLLGAEQHGHIAAVGFDTYVPDPGGVGAGAARASRSRRRRSCGSTCR